MILVALIGALFVYLIIFLVLWRVFSSEGRIQRDKEFTQRVFDPTRAQSAVPDFEKKAQISSQRLVKEFLDRYSLTKHIAIWLKRAKIRTSVSYFLIFSGLAGVLGFFLFRKYMNISMSFGVGILFAFLPIIYLRAQNKKYLKTFQEHFPDAISTLSNSIKVGHGLESAVEVVIESGVYPVNIEFETVRAELKLGVNIAQALQNFFNRLQIAEVRILATGIGLHEELGGNLSEVLDNLEKTIRERFALQREINVLSAQGRLSSYILTAIPFLIGFALFYLDTDNFGAFIGSEMGRKVLMLNGFALVISFFWMQHIVKLKE